MCTSLRYTPLECPMPPAKPSTPAHLHPNENALVGTALRLTIGSDPHASPEAKALAYQWRRIEKLHSQLAELEALRITFLPLFDQTLSPLRRRLDTAKASLYQGLQQRLQKGGLSPQQREVAAKWLQDLIPASHPAPEPNEPETPEQEQAAPPNSAQQRRQAKRQERRHSSPEGQQALQLQQTGDALLRTLYRQLASALHPDRETDPDKRLQKTDWMSQANTAYARHDWWALMQLKLRTDTTAGLALGPTPEKELKALTLLLKQQVANLERQRAKAQQALRYDLGLPKGQTIDLTALHPYLSAQVEGLQRVCADLEQLALAWQDDAQLNRWLKSALWPTPSHTRFDLDQ